MKDLFRGYYQRSDSEKSNLWATGTFCFDANVLLNFYEYSAETRNDFMGALKALYLDTHLPCDNLNAIETLGIPGEDLEHYRKIYRHFPAFTETEV